MILAGSTILGLFSTIDTFTFRKISRTRTGGAVGAGIRASAAGLIADFAYTLRVHKVTDIADRAGCIGRTKVTIIDASLTFSFIVCCKTRITLLTSTRRRTKVTVLNTARTESTLIHEILRNTFLAFIERKTTITVFWATLTLICVGFGEASIIARRTCCFVA